MGASYGSGRIGRGGFVLVAALSFAREARGDGTAAVPYGKAAQAEGVEAKAPAAKADSAPRKLVFAGGHAAYAVGGAVGDVSGFRQGLDVGAMAGLLSYDGGSSSGLPSNQTGLVFGASALTGFGAYPTYVAAEIGGSKSNAFTGAAGVLGPAVRVAPKAGGGVALRLSADLFLVQIGFHVIAVVVPDPEVVFSLTVGFGRY